MSTKIYHLNVEFFPNYPLAPRTAEVVERAERECGERLAALATELAAAGLSDGSYTQPTYPKLFHNYEFVVTNPREAALIAEKYSSDVYISKPGGRFFAFDSISSMPTWLYREVTPAQREFNTELYFVTSRLQYLVSIADNPEQRQLLRRIEANALKAANIEQLKAVGQRIAHHSACNPTWRWH